MKSQGAGGRDQGFGFSQKIAKGAKMGAGIRGLGIRGEG